MRARAPPDDVGPPEAGRFHAPQCPLFIEFLADALFKGAITFKAINNGARAPGHALKAERTQTPRTPVTEHAPPATHKKPGAHRPGGH